ncbi:hypothetical protein SASPL_127651 [Salvia splendens]|uniref:Pentatricopeptide repeat-containing protein-mitochondrial domain-containing protein n=1 Tax=Salvia splendens TaxID=180675 RepID=A0A8X8X9K7_SALSN|nr:hypothetical protein SASPL_127651 [Salvia splendens]
MKSMAAAAGGGAAGSSSQIHFGGNRRPPLFPFYAASHHSTRLLTIQHDSSLSYDSSAEIPLLQKLLKAPLSTIKSTLDSEFSSVAAEFPCAALLSSLYTSAPQKAYLLCSRLISLCGRIKNLHLALPVFSSMEEQGIIPASPVFNALISTRLSSGNLITALSLFEIMEGSESYKPDEDTYNAFISAYASMGNKTAAEDWFKAKVEAGFHADARAYGSLVHCCIKLRAYEDARRYFEEMLFEGILPDESSVIQDVLLMYCQQRNLQKVKEVLKFVRWRIDLNVCKKVVDLYQELGLAGDLEELVVALS